MREERKVVTALFADLQGSTALGEQLDAEDVKLIVGEAVARIVHAVEDYGGTVKDLAGDGVLALFGAPAAHEDDPERAVRAGLRIARGWKTAAADPPTHPRRFRLRGGRTYFCGSIAVFRKIASCWLQPG